MIPRMRVVLRPTEAPAHIQNGYVHGMNVSLSQFGASSTLAAEGEPRAAKLVWHAAFLEKARPDAARSFEPFATLVGSASFEGSPPRATFVGSGKPIEYSSPPADEVERLQRRKLRLEFDPETFRDVLDPEELNTLLVMPAEPEGMRFAEIDTELLIAGAPEAPLGTSAVLDVPLVPHTVFVRLFDGNGQLLPGASFEASVGEQSIAEGVSDDKGVAVIEGLAGSRDCVLRWGIDDQRVLHYERTVLFDLQPFTTRARLSNLGFDDEAGEAAQLRELRDEFGIPDTTLDDDVVAFLKGWHDDGVLEVPEAEAGSATTEPDFTDDELEEGAF